MFEIELFVCIKMDLESITYNGWYAIKPNQTKPTSMHEKDVSQGQFYEESNWFKLRFFVFLDWFIWSDIYPLSDKFDF